MLEEIKRLLGFSKNIAIITHRNPDGDAIGSSLALKKYLEKKNHIVNVLAPSEYPASLHFLPDIQSVIITDEEKNLAEKILLQADIIFCLDFNALDRIDKIDYAVSGNKNAVKIIIDHHLDPEPFADYIITDTEASSTSEIIFQFIQDLGEPHLIDIQIGECILTGIITDTGSFRYGTRANTYEVAAILKNLGVDDHFIQDKITNSLLEKNLRLLGHCLANRMEVLEEYRTAYIYLTKEDYKNFDIKRGDTEGIVNYLLMMKNVDIAAFIMEQPTIVKISLRSKGDISVQDMARRYFRGGGHKNASGGGVYAKLEDIIERFKEVIPKYIPKVEV
ncbi:MAG TPA: bifunctional oligoribonuclease/PAP phosphatase NrnA [Saprospiraceae bacterium]|nr:bifunctional oligoribonuclease/PAP phosphatase NrnA [Saprospiraceae bacterium]